MKVLVTQSCPTLCDPMDCSLQCSSVHGVFQVRILEGVATRASDKCSLQSFLSRGPCWGAPPTSSSLFSGLKAALSNAALELSVRITYTEKIPAMSSVCVYVWGTVTDLLHSACSVLALSGDTESSGEHTAPGDTRHGHSSCPTDSRVVSPRPW